MQEVDLKVDLGLIPVPLQMGRPAGPVWWVSGSCLGAASWQALGRYQCWWLDPASRWGPGQRIDQGLHSSKFFGGPELVSATAAPPGGVAGGSGRGGGESSATGNLIWLR